MRERKLSPDQELRMSARAAKAARLSCIEAHNEDRPIVDIFCSDRYGTRISDQGMGIDPVTGEIVYAIVDATVVDQDLIMDSWRAPDARTRIADAMALRPGKEALTPVVAFRISEDGIVRACLERARTNRRVQDKNKNVARDLKHAAVKAGVLDQSFRNEAIGYCEVAIADACMRDLVDRANSSDTSLSPIADYRFTAPLRNRKSLHNLHVAAFMHGLST